MTINEYANVREFEGEQREDLFYLIQAMDKAYLDYKPPATGKGK